jgi:hypothetical protein
MDRFKMVKMLEIVMWEFEKLFLNLGINIPIYLGVFK